MKLWAFRILKIFLILSILVVISITLFVKWTLSETSLGILDDKIGISATDTPITLEDGSLVKNDELKSFLLFSGEKLSFEEFLVEKKQDQSLRDLVELPGLLQINKNIEIKNLLQNDCADVYCYQHYLSFDYIPSIFWKGLIAVEDQRYLEHFGIDFKSVFRAFVTNMRQFRFAQGGSTISQQLVKNVFLTNEKTFSRKLKEVIVSIYIETKYPKEKILEAYLNEVYWGALQGIRVKGVFAASLFYFGKKPSDITSYEGAILISLLKGPSYFSPLKSIERLKERAKIVYEKLLLENQISSDPKEIWSKTDWNRFLLRLKQLEEKQYYQSMWRALHDQELGLSRYEKFVLIQKVADVKQKIQVKDISVKVLIGPIGGAETYSYYSKIERNKDRAIKKETHQIGSTIKPILYSIFEDLGKKLNDKVLTAEIKLKLLSGEWSPKESHRNLEKEVTLLDALLKSYNRPVIRLANELGFDQVEGKLKPYFPKLKLPLREFPSELLGASEMSLDELRISYSQFISDECKKLQSGGRANDESVLFALSDPNQTTVEYSVDAVMKKLRFFGKTGTTNNGYDNWYVAFDGKNLSLIWVGFEGQRTTKSLGLYGATTAFNVFQNFYRDRGKRFVQFGCNLVN
jgi:penicillin-binding protein 1B